MGLPEKSQDIKERLSLIRWADEFAFECYDIKIGIRTDVAGLKSKIKKNLPKIRHTIDFERAVYVVSIVAGENEIEKGLYFNNELAMNVYEFSDSEFEFIGEKILSILAFYSLPAKFYLHAGAVSWKNLGIVLPGLSYSGKTTLTRDFIKAGAAYITDDLTILDNRGEILPFPRKLAIRTDRGRALKNADYFGAKTIKENIKLDLILFTQYEPAAVWTPGALSKGQAILKLLDNFYYRNSVGEAPAEILPALVEITQDAKIFAGERGDTKSVIEWVDKNF